MTGYITAIFTAPAKHAEQCAVDSVQLKAGKGIVGDRFYGVRKHHVAKNLTLIESEVIAEFNNQYHQCIGLNASRRNLITQGIRLNDLVGKTFHIGQVLCQGIELCEPCHVMARHFQCNSLSENEIIKAFAGKGGIRAQILSDGIVRVGDTVA
jgi:MOSC domain-containing protein YiiM